MGSNVRLRPGYQRWKSLASWSLRTRMRTWSRRWAPRGVQRICCFLTMRLAMTWLTADSVNALQAGGELVVEEAYADLEQEVGAAGCPAHLLFFDHAFGDDLVDRGFGERCGDGLASTLAFPVVGDPLGVGADVAVELADRLEQPGLLRAGLGDVEIEDQVVGSLQGAEDVARSEEHT